MNSYNAPFRSAQKLYEQHGGQFRHDLGAMLGDGVVINTPDTFLMGYFFAGDNVKQPVRYSQSDGVFVVLCVGQPKPALHQLVELTPLVAYERALRGDKRVRIVDIKTLYSKL